MKRTGLLAAALLLSFTGCTTCCQGLSNWRPNCFGRMHDSIQGSNVGAPCMSGNCATAAPPMPAAPLADAGCATCGNGVQNLGYEGYPTSSYSGEVIGGNYAGTVQSSPVYSGEQVPSVRAQ